MSGDLAYQWRDTQLNRHAVQFFHAPRVPVPLSELRLKDGLHGRRDITGDIDAPPFQCPNEKPI
jgi:hypothetical protein